MSGKLQATEVGERSAEQPQRIAATSVLGGSRRFDAAAQIAALEAAMAAPAGHDAREPQQTSDQTHTADAVTSRAKPARRITIKFSHVLKIAVALAFIAVLGWRPAQRLLYVTSTEAIVNSRLVTLRAPIDGTLLSSEQLRMGALVETGQTLLRIENALTDRSRLADIEHLLRAKQIEQQTIASRLTELTAQQTEIAAQVSAFQAGRIAELTARETALAASLDSAIERQNQAVRTLARAETLADKGAGTLVNLERANSDQLVAAFAVETAQQTLDSLKVELAAARSGYFVGDGYNDVPASVQRSREINTQIIALRTTSEQLASTIADLRSQLAEESGRYAVTSAATIAAPASGRVWEVLASPGEYVRRGQDLMRVVDCSLTVVTAAVSEASFNALSLEQRATFRFRGEKVEHEARIIGLNGLASVPANFAILQNALLREPYHVTVELFDKATSAQCNVGRTGIVTFVDAQS